MQTRTEGRSDMPRYIVERTFPGGLDIPTSPEGLRICRSVVDRNADHGVTWVHSYVSEDKGTTFCVYDAPSPESIRAAASRNDLPVDRITQVRVLDPYFYL
jgi:Nickel responsive protein SCO4226-like